MKEQSVVGRKFQRYYGDGSNTPWLDDQALQERIQDNWWHRWDGVPGTAESHMDWMHQQAESLMSDERREEFRPWGHKSGVEYSIHDGLTKDADGYGLFKLEGTLELDPKDLVGCMFDLPSTAAADDTVVMMKNLKTFVQDDSFVATIYWCNAPGFPFHYRDGLDLSGFRKDDNGVVWQLSMSVDGCDAEHPSVFRSMPYAIGAQNRYWAYRLEAIDEGSTKVTLLCQSKLNGWIPKPLSNYMVCSVLVDYMGTMTRVVKQNKESGEHQKLLKRLGIENL